MPSLVTRCGMDTQGPENGGAGPIRGRQPAEHLPLHVDRGGCEDLQTAARCRAFFPRNCVANFRSGESLAAPGPSPRPTLARGCMLGDAPAGAQAPHRHEGGDEVQSGVQLACASDAGAPSRRYVCPPPTAGRGPPHLSYTEREGRGQTSLDLGRARDPAPLGLLLTTSLA